MTDIKMTKHFKKFNLYGCSLLTLYDVKDYLQMRVAEQQSSVVEKMSVTAEVGTVADPDGDYEAAILILVGRMIIYSDANTPRDLLLGKKLTYHLQAWSRAGQEYRHLAKTDNLGKLIELGFELSVGDSDKHENSIL